MTQSIAISIAALLALLPVTIHAFAVAEGRMTAAVGVGPDGSGAKNGAGHPGLAYWAFLGVAVLGMVAQLAHLLQGGWQPGVGPTIWVSMAATLFVFSASVLAMKDLWRLTPLLGVYLAGLGALALFLPQGADYRGSLDVWLVLHIALSLAAFGLVTIAALAALGVFLQERALKRKRPGRLTHALPSVADGEALEVRLLQGAAVVLALGIVTGMAELYVTSGSLLVFNHKVLLSLLGFAATAGLLVLHQGIGLRGRKAARLVLLAFLLLALGYPGVKFVTDVIIAA